MTRQAWQREARQKLWLEIGIDINNRRDKGS
jgi:hypothetical protein